MSQPNQPNQPYQYGQQQPVPQYRPQHGPYPGYPQHFAPQPPQAPQAPKKGHWWSGRLAVGIGAGLLGLIIGSAGASGSPTTSAAPAAAPAVTVTAPANGEPAPTVTVTAQPKPAPTVTVTQKAEAPAPKKPEPKAAFSDGQYVVGEDIEPGRYRTVQNAQDVSNYLCYLDVQDDGEYLAQEVTDKGKTIVNIKKSWKGAVLDSSGCGDWQKD